jgi:hypothetical protein
MPEQLLPAGHLGRELGIESQDKVFEYYLLFRRQSIIRIKSS